MEKIRIGQIIGVKRAKGEYQGVNYDNILISYIGKDNQNLVVGNIIENIKIKSSDLDTILKVYKIDLNDLVNCYINDVSYDKYGKVKSIDIKF